MRIKTNENDPNLFCHYSKQRIGFGEKYVEVIDKESADFFGRIYKLEYYEMLQDDEDDENDVYLCTDDLDEFQNYSFEG